MELHALDGQTIGRVGRGALRNEEYQTSVHVPVFYHFAFLPPRDSPWILPQSTKMATEHLHPHIPYPYRYLDVDFLRRGYRVARCSSAE